MTKKEIYERIVELTGEITQTGYTTKVFNVVKDDDAEAVQVVINAFPYLYPVLYQDILCFGRDFNEFVGDTPEAEEEFEDIHDLGKDSVHSLFEINFFSKMMSAYKSGDAESLKKVFGEFQNKYSEYFKKMLSIEKEYNTRLKKLRRKSHDGGVFGLSDDARKGLHKFNPEVINPVSFFFLVMLSGILEVELFYAEEDDENLGSVEFYADALEKVLGKGFSNFVLNYNLVTWVGDGRDYETLGEILTDIMFDRFENSELLEDDELDEHDSEDWNCVDESDDPNDCH